MNIEYVRGDITEQRVDAVVNAANSSLLGGGGVDGAIHRRGGPEILAECRELRAGPYRDGLPTGRAVSTTAGQLLARWVIHTVGPVWSKREDRSALLASCYRESLRVADELGAATVAFPAVSAGVYLGFLAGPPMIGGISELAGLRIGLLVLVVLCLVAAALGGAVRVPDPVRR